jgi:hypothetical protein
MPHSQFIQRIIAIHLPSCSILRCVGIQRTSCTARPSLNFLSRRCSGILLTPITSAATLSFSKFYFFSLFFSSRQIHNAVIRARSTPGATCTPYVCWPKKMSLPLRILRSMRATTAPVVRNCVSYSSDRRVNVGRRCEENVPPIASSTISADVSNQFPFIVRISCFPPCEVNVAVALLPITIQIER